MFDTFCDSKLKTIIKQDYFTTKIKIKKNQTCRNKKVFIALIKSKDKIDEINFKKTSRAI